MQPLRRPVIAVICGSTRQRADFEQLNMDLTLAGRIVLTVGMFGHEIGLDMEGETKRQLDELHLRKIDLADEVHVILKPDGSLGESTAREQAYAQDHGKPIIIHDLHADDRLQCGSCGHKVNSHCDPGEGGHVLGGCIHASCTCTKGRTSNG